MPAAAAAAATGSPPALRDARARELVHTAAYTDAELYGRVLAALRYAAGKAEKAWLVTPKGQAIVARIFREVARRGAPTIDGAAELGATASSTDARGQNGDVGINTNGDAAAPPSPSDAWYREFCASYVSSGGVAGTIAASAGTGDDHNPGGGGGDVVHSAAGHPPPGTPGGAGAAEDKRTHALGCPPRAGAPHPTHTSGAKRPRPSSAFHDVVAQLPVGCHRWRVAAALAAATRAAYPGGCGGDDPLSTLRSIGSAAGDRRLAEVPQQEPVAGAAGAGAGTGVSLVDHPPPLGSDLSVRAAVGVVRGAALLVDDAAAAAPLQAAAVALLVDVLAAARGRGATTTTTRPTFPPPLSNTSTHAARGIAAARAPYEFLQTVQAPILQRLQWDAMCGTHPELSGVRAAMARVVADAGASLMAAGASAAAASTTTPHPGTQAAAAGGLVRRGLDGKPESSSAEGDPRSAAIADDGGVDRPTAVGVGVGAISSVEVDAAPVASLPRSAEPSATAVLGGPGVDALESSAITAGRETQAPSPAPRDASPLALIAARVVEAAALARRGQQLGPKHGCVLCVPVDAPATSGVDAGTAVTPPATTAATPPHDPATQAAQLYHVIGRGWNHNVYLDQRGGKSKIVLHAEVHAVVDALRRYGERACLDALFPHAVALVVELVDDHAYSDSHPCPKCHTLLRGVGVTRALFTTAHGDVGALDMRPANPELLDRELARVPLRAACDEAGVRCGALEAAEARAVAKGATRPAAKRKDK